jgi:hypothetical protein
MPVFPLYSVLWLRGPGLAVPTIGLGIRSQRLGITQELTKTLIFSPLYHHSTFLSFLWRRARRRGRGRGKHKHTSRREAGHTMASPHVTRATMSDVAATENTKGIEICASCKASTVRLQWWILLSGSGRPLSLARRQYSRPCLPGPYPSRLPVCLPEVRQGGRGCRVREHDCLGSHVQHI